MKALATLCGLLLPCIALAGAPKCFLPQRSDRSAAATFVDPKAAECRAFEEALNATCAGDIPMVEFKPMPPSSELRLPDWSAIALYKADGGEDSAAFARLEKLVWAQAIATYSVEREARAKRDTESVVAAIRAAHAAGKSPRFDRASLDLVGHGQAEPVYRLYFGVAHNPSSIVDEFSSGKSEPKLFLERAIAQASRADLDRRSPQFAGSDLTNAPADILLFHDVPHILKWSAADSVLVYSAYLRRDRARIASEENQDPMLIMPVLRCVFAFRPSR